jgi:hypothetical protein
MIVSGFLLQITTIIRSRPPQHGKELLTITGPGAPELA